MLRFILLIRSSFPQPPFLLESWSFTFSTKWGRSIERNDKKMKLILEVLVPGLFFYPQTTNQLVVDTARGETLTINVSCVVPPPPSHRPQICFNNSQTFSLENSQHLICAPRNHFEELPNIRLCALRIVQKNHFNLQPKTKKVQHSSANFRVFLNLGF
jgi:hypothetical protein